MRASTVTTRRPRPFCECGQPSHSSRALLCSSCRDARKRERRRKEDKNRYQKRLESERIRARERYNREPGPSIAKSTRWRLNNRERYNALAAGYAWKRRIRKRFGTLPDAMLMEMLSALRKFRSETGWRDR